MLASYFYVILRAMDTQDPRAGKPEKLIRTSVLLREGTDRRLRNLAAATDKPLSRHLRKAVEEYVDREEQLAA